MASKEIAASATFSRDNVLCFYCDIEISRHNIKAHTNSKHPGKPVKEKIKRVRGQSSLDMFMTKDNSKKAKLDTAVLEQDDEEEEIKINTSNSENVLESDLITFNQIKNLMKENTEEIKEAIDNGVKSLQKDFNQEIPSVEVTDDDIDDNYNLDKARTIEEICETIPELIHYPHFKTLRCNLCAEEGMENLNLTGDYHWTGVFKYNRNLSAIDKNLPLDSDIRNIKKSIKRHFKSQTHKSNIVDIENKVRTIYKGRDDIKDNNAAAMRCARLCLYLFKRGGHSLITRTWLLQLWQVEHTWEKQTTAHIFHPHIFQVLLMW